MKQYNGSRTIATYALAGGVGLGALAIGGCGVSRGELEKTLEEYRQKNIVPIQRQVTDLKRKPDAEGPITIYKGTGYDDLYGALRQEILRQFENKRAKNTAERRSNAVRLISTHDPAEYIGVLVRDDGNRRLEPGNDKKYADIGADGQEYVGFPINVNNLPEQVRVMLLNARDIPPISQPASPPK